VKLWNKGQGKEGNTEQNRAQKSIKTLGKGLLGFWGRHKFLTLVLVLSLCAVVFFLVTRGRRGRMPQREQVRIIETATVERMDLANSISVTGTIASAEKYTGTTTLSNVEVAEVYVAIGDMVQEGDIICRFDSADIEEALATARNNYSVNQEMEALDGDYAAQYAESVADAEDALESAKSKRDDAKAAWTSASSSESSAKTKLETAQKALADHKGAYETAAQEAKEAIAAYKGSASADLITNLDVSIEDMERANSGEIPTEELKTTITGYRAAKEAYEAAQKEASDAQAAYDKAKSATTSAYNTYANAQTARENAQEIYEDSLEQAQRTYDKAVLDEQLISDTEETSKIEAYEEQLADCTVYASMTGVITSLSVKAGEKFGGGTIYEIQDQNYFVVEASVDEYDIVDIAKGMAAYVKTDSMGEEEMEAQVTYVAPVGTTGMQMGSASGTASYEIEITIQEPQERLRAGMTAQVSISLEESKDTLAVPYDCVQTNANGETVIYMEEDGERKEVVVETGIETDYYTEIISEEIGEGMRVYLGTQMMQSTGTDSEENTEEGMMGFPMGGGIPGGNMGGGMPGGNAGGRPSGGGNMGGRPGGF